MPICGEGAAPHCSPQQQQEHQAEVRAREGALGDHHQDRDRQLSLVQPTSLTLPARPSPRSPPRQQGDVWGSWGDLPPCPYLLPCLPRGEQLPGAGRQMSPQPSLVLRHPLPAHACAGPAWCPLCLLQQKIPVSLFLPLQEMLWQLLPVCQLCQAIPGHAALSLGQRAGHAWEGCACS